MSNDNAVSATDAVSNASDKLAALTRQQINVLEFSSQGLKASEVAQRMGLSEKGVKFHKTRLYKTLGVRSITQALLAYEKLTTDTTFTKLAPGEYRTPSYTQVKQALASLNNKYVALLELHKQVSEVAKRDAAKVEALTYEVQSLRTKLEVATQAKLAPLIHEAIAELVSGQSNRKLQC